jgi:hypothetical protein
VEILKFCRNQLRIRLLRPSQNPGIMRDIRNGPYDCYSASQPE